MGLANFTRFNKGDYPDAPEYIFKMFDALNLQVENITTLLQGSGNVTDIFNVEERQIELKSDEETIVSLKKLKGKPTKSYIMWSSVYEYPQYAWRIIDQDKVAVKVKFTSATQGTVKLRFEA